MLDVNIKKNLAYISRRMYEANLKEQDYKKLEKCAQYCLRHEDELDNKVEIVYARLLYQQKKYSLSRAQYNRAKSKNPNAATIYYGLYKNYVMEGKWDLALENLNIYIDMIKDKKRVDGFNIIYALLAYLRDEEIQIEIPLDIFLSQEIKDETIEEKYEALIESIATGKYALSIKLSEELEKISRENDNLMEFITINNLLMHAHIKKNKEFDEYSIDKINEAIRNKEYGLLSNILYYQAKKIHIPIKIMDYIPILIENGYHMEAKDILNVMQSKQENHRVRAYYRKSIKDHEIMANYTDEELAFHNDSLYTINNALLAETYTDAFDMALAAMYKLDHPIFLYYMGLSAFYLEDYKTAISYFNAYNRRGAEKNISSRYFLACCYKNLGKTRQFYNHRRRYIRYCNILNQEKNLNFNAYSYEPYYEKEENNLFEDSIYRIVNNPLYCELQLLLKHQKLKEVNKILYNLQNKEDKTEEDKLILRYINKNKKLYLNKNK